MGLFHSIFIAEQVGSAHSALHLPGLSRGDKYSRLLNLHWTCFTSMITGGTSNGQQH